MDKKHKDKGVCDCDDCSNKGTKSKALKHRMIGAVKNLESLRKKKTYER